MTQLMEATDTYRATFELVEKDLAALGPPWLYRKRLEAVMRFEQLGFPTTDEEEWRFTNTAPLTQVPFTLAERRKAALPSNVRFRDTHLLVFVNGRHVPELSELGALPRNVLVASLEEVLQRHPESVEPHLTAHARWEEHAFTALNTAFFRDGAVISIPRGQVVESPIHLIFLAVSRGEPAVAHPRTLIVVGENSQVRILETYLSQGETPTFTNAVTEVVLGENAAVEHYKVQREGTEAFHIATLQVLQQRSSRCSLLSVALGGSLARNDVNVLLAGEGCESTLHGLTLAGGRQLTDHHTRIDHVATHCLSRQLYKAVIDDHAHAVFNGKIYVHPNAQKTDARQTNQTLLLSEDAVINTKPQLEIFADDVKCTHGATVGQLDPDALFYLRTRGINSQTARALLTYAFANEIVAHIPIESLRTELEEMLGR